MFLLLSNIMESPCKKLKLENYKSENIKSENKHILNVIIKNPRLVKRRDALWNIFEIK
jgi:hypothetical protein